MRRPRKVSNIMLITSVSAVVLYTAIQVILLCVAEIELPEILTGSWYTFWGSEIVALATIKNNKTKHGVDAESDNVEESDSNSVYDSEDDEASMNNT